MTEMAKALSEEMEKNEQLEKQITEAKNLLREFVLKSIGNVTPSWDELITKAEAFLE